jgi:pyrroline-5-carboxylate reductase
MSLSGIGPVVLVGAGKMGLALAGGWLKAGLPPAELVMVDPQPSDAAIALAEEHRVRLVSSVEGILIPVVVLAVKPQIASTVMGDLRPHVGKHTLGISIAAGIALRSLMLGLGTERVIRSMPNTPAQVGKGITGAVAGSKVGEKDKAVAQTLLAAAGDIVWFEDEASLDAVTAVSGSGPAYVFNLVEALAQAAVAEGLSEDDATRLARATVVGAAALLEADPQPASVLRQNVTSPNGTTAAALAVLMGDNGLTPLIGRAVRAARLRSEELGRGAR